MMSKLIKGLPTLFAMSIFLLGAWFFHLKILVFLAIALVFTEDKSDASSIITAIGAILIMLQFIK